MTWLHMKHYGNGKQHSFQKGRNDSTLILDLKRNSIREWESIDDECSCAEHNFNTLQETLFDIDFTFCDAGYKNAVENEEVDDK